MDQTSVSHPRLSALVLVLVLAAAAPPFAAQQVLVVGAVPAPGVEYIDLQKAVMAAPPGATLLLRAGDYGGFFLPSKSLHFTAEPGAVVRLSTSIVFHLDADETVTLRGIDFHSDASMALQISECAGPVWIEDAEIDQGSHAAAGALAIVDSPSVTLVRTRVVGPLLQTALRIVATDGATTHVDAFDCEFIGGKGKSEVPLSPNAGGAVMIDGGTLYASGTAIRGGDAGFYDDPQFGCWQGTGGPGVRFVAAATPSLLAAQDTTITGGAGSTACGAPAVDGPATTGPGTLVPIAGTPRALVTNSPVREGFTATLAFHGAAGELALLAIGAPVVGSGASTWHTFASPVLIGAPLQVLVAGFVPPSGVLGKSFVVQELGLGVEGFAVHAQPVFAQLGAASAQLGAPAQFVLLEAEL
ncbi:MAG: hypothetical protein EPO68_07590 [Planctomycetota bacterium]|nr:MAG: hypothetical protein EPO68_07590 [Planctomycetota bacterium]